jgi:predicted deacylase
MMRFGNIKSKNVLMVIGRQHPPEVTGSRALMRFVDRLTSESALARAFRADTLVLVVPLVNPDGVVQGQWRGNANGKDLNRDWGTFTQPETRAVRTMLRRKVEDAGRHLVFAIDFHSTWSDVFYTVKEAPSRAAGGVLRRWIDAMQARFPGRIREKANAAKGTVFKNWAFRRYHAPAVTYEVGDRTSDEKIETLASFAADQLMRILLAPKPAQH